MIHIFCQSLKRKVDIELVLRVICLIIQLAVTKLIAFAICIAFLLDQEF